MNANKLSTLIKKIDTMKKDNKKLDRFLFFRFFKKKKLNI